jgi:hypothetical protein
MNAPGCLDVLNKLQLSITLHFLFIFQATSLDIKQLWVKKLRELIQERFLYMNATLQEPVIKPVYKQPHTAATKMNFNPRSSR